jgi:hypothetical protein
MSDTIALKLPCQPCRTSRTRCDRLSPSCTRCQTRGLGSTCRYVTTLPHGRTRQSHVRSRSHHHRPCQECKRRHVRCHHHQLQQHPDHASRSGGSSVDTTRNPYHHLVGVGRGRDGTGPPGDGSARRASTTTTTANTSVAYSGPASSRSKNHVCMFTHSLNVSSYPMNYMHKSSSCLLMIFSAIIARNMATTTTTTSTRHHPSGHLTT